MNAKVETSVDWLNFTVKGTENPNWVIEEYLRLDPALFEASYGRYGYMKGISFQNILVLFEPYDSERSKDMGILVTMSGQGCRSFEAMTQYSKKEPAFQQLLCKLSEDPDCHVSRLDVACDDHVGLLDMNEIFDRVQSRQVNTRITKFRFVGEMSSKNREGLTVYFGSASSDFRIRIYDKAYEQGVEGHWVRVEMVLQGQNGDAFSAELASGTPVGELAAMVLNDKLSFIERDDCNISRCTVCGWWSAFVDELRKLQLVAREAAKHPIQYIRDWLEYQIGPSLALIRKTMGFGTLLDISHSAENRLTRKQDSLIADYKSRMTGGAVYA